MSIKPKITNVINAANDIAFEERLKKLSEFVETTAYTKEEYELDIEGYNKGYARDTDISKEKFSNPIFRKGYDRGLRTRAANEFQEKINFVEELVKNNIPFELAQEKYELDSNLKAHYDLFSLRMKIEKIKNIKR